MTAALVALAAPAGVGAQQAGKVPHVGWLQPSQPPSAGYANFRRAMRELGYREGENGVSSRICTETSPTLVSDAMRTTLTLDRDVAALLRQAQTRRKEPLTRIVNEALRQGLLQMAASPRRAGRYRIKPVHLGRCLLGNLDDVAEALAVAEGDAYR